MQASLASGQGCRHRRARVHQERQCESNPQVSAADQQCMCATTLWIMALSCGLSIAQVRPACGAEGLHSARCGLHALCWSLGQGAADSLLRMPEGGLCWTLSLGVCCPAVPCSLIAPALVWVSSVLGSARRVSSACWRSSGVWSGDACLPVELRNPAQSGIFVHRSAGGSLGHSVYPIRSRSMHSWELGVPDWTGRSCENFGCAL